ncbi:DUF1345 domain-containing protein [Gordonia sinesedis]
MAKFVASPAFRLVSSPLVGLVAGVVTAVAGAGVGTALLVGMAVAFGVFVTEGWVVLWPMDGEQTRRNAVREDYPHRVDELVVVLASVGALLGIGALLIARGSQAGWFPATMALIGVFLAWASLHLMYATRYANIYYTRQPAGGIDFNSNALPTFADFLCFSYNLGMTYQVSDTNVSNPTIRSVVLRQCLLSYIFGAVILATTINLVAGIFTG